MGPKTFEPSDVDFATTSGGFTDRTNGHFGRTIWLSKSTFGCWRNSKASWVYVKRQSGIYRIYTEFRGIRLLWISLNFQDMRTLENQRHRTTPFHFGADLLSTTGRPPSHSAATRSSASFFNPRVTPGDRQQIIEAPTNQLPCGWIPMKPQLIMPIFPCLDRFRAWFFWPRWQVSMGNMMMNHGMEKVLILRQPPDMKQIK